MITDDENNSDDVLTNGTELEDTTDPLSTIVHSTTIHLTRAFWLFESIQAFISPNQSEEEKKKHKAIVMEILRAQIVLAHAILEDGLREILRVKLRGEISPEILATVPLVGVSQSGQPKKFGLEDLARHRGKTVEELLQVSVDDYLDRISFTSCENIAGMLEKCGIDVLELEKYFPNLDQMITRRHQIVHRADRIGEVGRWHISTVDPNDSLVWMVTVFLFIVDVGLLAHAPEERAELQKELDENANLKEVLSAMRQYIGKEIETLDTACLREKLQGE